MGEGDLPEGVKGNRYRYVSIITIQTPNPAPKTPRVTTTNLSLTEHPLTSGRLLGAHSYPLVRQSNCEPYLRCATLSLAGLALFCDETPPLFDRCRQSFRLHPPTRSLLSPLDNLFRLRGRTYIYLYIYYNSLLPPGAERDCIAARVWGSARSTHRQVNNECLATGGRPASCRRRS